MVTGPSSSKTRHWLFSKWIDLGVLYVPLWIIWIIFLTNQAYFTHLEMPNWVWFVFILGIDVSHVWSSLFRSYLDKEEFNAHKTRLIVIPILLLAASISILVFSPHWFWRIMAYLAVFHFIKQQYGFLALYNFRTGKVRKKRISDKLIIYIATLYPVVYWHFYSASTLNWFGEGDFFELAKWIKNPETVQLIFQSLNWVYWGVIFYWVIEEFVHKSKGGVFSWGKILWTLTTAINWWFGIVYFNSDVIFSVSNVVAHGIPYVALVYFYDVNKHALKSELPPKALFLLKRLAIILGVILVAAVVEEYFWDMFVYQERAHIFERIYPYNWEQLSSSWSIAIGVAILALPQQVHYVMDGFIWKMNAKNKYLKPIFSKNDES